MRKVANGLQLFPVNANPSLNMTIYEVYLDFRTAGLSIPASLASTTVFVCPLMQTSWDFGQEIGGVVSSIIQRYDQPLWDAIGGTEANMPQELAAAKTAAEQAQIMDAMYSLFGASH
ncbi:MAG: hypothetical protein ACREUG_00765 [Steroidobacteraceae bacterium]